MQSSAIPFPVIRAYLKYLNYVQRSQKSSKEFKKAFCFKSGVSTLLLPFCWTYLNKSPCVNNTWLPFKFSLRTSWMMIARRGISALYCARCTVLTTGKIKPSSILLTRFIGDEKKKKVVAPLNWKSFFGSVAVMGVFFGTAYYYKKQKELEMQKQRRRALGKAAIGGPFNLIDYDEKPVSSKDFLGSWLLIYFGFTHCPDICPDEMEKMCKVADTLEAKGHKVTPIFISVDPQRDTPSIVKSYCKEFSPKLLGLTGTKEQVDAATRAYRVYYSAGPADAANDYIVDHTIIMYLINPEGEFVDYYGQSKTAEEISKGIDFTMSKYEAMNKKSWFSSS